MQKPDLKKYTELREQLVKRELKPPPVNADFYLQLTALLLYYNELTYARFVWKRIPPELKAENEHIKRMHFLTSALFSSTPHAFFKYVEWDWPEHIKELMNDLKDKVRYDIFNLIGNAYQSLEEEKLAEMTHLTIEKVKQACKELNWQYTTSPKGVLFVLPKKPPIEVLDSISSEAQLFKLTDFVSFLEN